MPLLRMLGHALRPVRPGPMALTTSRYSGFLGAAVTLQLIAIFRNHVNQSFGHCT